MATTLCWKLKPQYAYQIPNSKWKAISHNRHCKLDQMFMCGKCLTSFWGANSKENFVWWFIQLNWMICNSVSGVNLHISEWVNDDTFDYINYNSVCWMSDNVHRISGCGSIIGVNYLGNSNDICDNDLVLGGVQIFKSSIVSSLNLLCINVWCSRCIEGKTWTRNPHHWFQIQSNIMPMI